MWKLGHLTRALYLELFPWLINPRAGPGSQQLVTDRSTDLQFRSHIQLLEGSGGVLPLAETLPSPQGCRLCKGGWLQRVPALPRSAAAAGPRSRSPSHLYVAPLSSGWIACWSITDHGAVVTKNSLFTQFLRLSGMRPAVGEKGEAVSGTLS